MICDTPRSLSGSQREPKDPDDIDVGAAQLGVAITPDGATAYVATEGSPNTVSTIDVASRTKDPDDIPGFDGPTGVAITPCP